MMKGVCLRYASNEEEAEDILQDAFVLAFKKLELYNGTGALGGWLRKLTVNKALEYCRKKKRLKSMAVDFSTSKLDPLVDDSVLDTLNAADLLLKIQQLSVGYRTVFNLYAIEGYTHKEIAELLEISEGTSKSQFSRARKLLVEMIENEVQHEINKLNYAR